MDLSISVITCTGDRPEAFALCNKWINHQTVQDFTWIVVDDGQTPVVPKRENLGKVMYLRAEPEPEVNTLQRNFLLALKAVNTEWVVVFEDDDYFAPRYLQTFLAAMPYYSVLGIGDAVYYHMSGKYRMVNNRTYAPLTFTAFHSSLSTSVRLAMENKTFKTFDIAFWRAVSASTFAKIMFNEELDSVGVKGLPGRAGIGIGHRDLTSSSWKNDDSDFTVAQELFKDNFKDYKPFIQMNK